MQVRWFASEKKTVLCDFVLITGNYSKISRIQDVLETLGGHKYFTTLDMSKALHQGFMHDNFHYNTAFTPPRDFTSGLGSRLICQQHPQLFNNLSPNVCQD